MTAWRSILPQEPTPVEFEAFAHGLTLRLAEYLRDSQSGEGPVLQLRRPVEIAQQLKLDVHVQSGWSARSVEDFLDAYLANTTRVHHPRYMGHQVGVPTALGALGDLVHGLTNNSMSIYEMGPAAAVVERSMVDWLLGHVGWSRSRWPGEKDPAMRPAGVLTHGGSLANLTALLAARSTVAPDAWSDGTPADLVLLASRACHYSVSRAAAIMGLGEHRIRHLPLNDVEVLIPDRLPQVYRSVRDAGERVLAVVTNACATSTGLYDPLDEVGQFCREEGLWLHVDGAHGASALISTRERHHLKGVELADSLIWDAHKLLRVPCLCTAVLFRDEHACDRAFHQEASYLFYEQEAMGIDVIHRTFECTKAGLGLKLFFALAAQGQGELAAYVESRVDLARAAAMRIRSRAGFECPFDPESNVVCFRWGQDDDRQIAIRSALLKEGMFHVTSTEVAGRRYLRLCLMNATTEIADVERLLDRIELLGASQSATSKGSPR